MLARWNADGGDERFRFDYPLDADSIVLDLGGYEGQWASDLYARQRCRIHIFEPLPDFAQAISARFERNPDIDTHVIALGGSTRTETLGVAGASSSAHKRRAMQVEVRFRDACDWFEETGIAEVALMKINIEGGEYELLERMIESGFVNRVTDIQVQFHNFVANADSRMAAIQQGLEATHQLSWQYRYIWENWHRKEANV